MNRPTFTEGVMVALCGAIATPMLAMALALMVPIHEQGVWLCLLLGLAYGSYLSARSPIAGGRLLLMLAWALVSLLCASLFPTLFPQLLVQLGFIWIARAWFFHTRPMAVLIDAALVAVGAGAALWALLHTGSLLVSAWTWLLIQALFVLIPGFGQSSVDTAISARDFATAEKAAERALRRLAWRS